MIARFIRFLMIVITGSPKELAIIQKTALYLTLTIGNTMQKVIVLKTPTSHLQAYQIFTLSMITCKANDQRRDILPVYLLVRRFDLTKRRSLMLAILKKNKRKFKD